MTTSDSFRRIALSMPEAIEASHMGHPDFRVNGKVFASLWPDDEWGMVKLTLEQQEQLVEARPGTFAPVNGAWGRRGATRVRLDEVDRATLRKAIAAAWANTAPKRLLKDRDQGEKSP